jgi:dihydroorotase
VTPHHLVLHDGWVAGDRRWAWQAIDAPWTEGPNEAGPYDTATRVNPPLRPPGDAAALAAGLSDGTIDAIATDHAPHAEVAKAVEYGEAATGISGLETALGQLLAAVDAGVLDLLTVVRALTVGPNRVLGAAGRSARSIGHVSGPASGLIGQGSGPGSEASRLVVGAPADLVVVDRGSAWRVDASSLLTLGHNTPLFGRELAGRVRMTLAAGRWAWIDDRDTMV